VVILALLRGNFSSSAVSVEPSDSRFAALLVEALLLRSA